MNISEAANHPIVEYAKIHLLGSGVITIPVQFEAEFDNLPKQDQQLIRAFFTGATTRCGVAKSLAKDPDYGPAYQERRYTSVNFWYGYLKETLPPHLSRSFGSIVDFNSPAEKLQKYDHDWLPAGRELSVSGPATYEGFVVPRIIIDIINHALKNNTDVSRQVINALTLIEVCTSIYFAIPALAMYMEILGISDSDIKKRLFDTSISTELPQSYWLPIFEIINGRLPQNLKYDRS